MLVDGLKIGARDHARAVIPVSAISVVAGAGYAECHTVAETYWVDLVEPESLIARAIGSL